MTDNTYIFPFQKYVCLYGRARVSFVKVQEGMAFLVIFAEFINNFWQTNVPVTIYCLPSKVIRVLFY